MKQICLIFILILSIQCSIYQKYYDEGYSIAASMTLEEKIGQTVQLDFYALSTKNGTDPSLATRMHLGSLLVGGNGAPDADGNLIAFPDMDETKTIELYKQATLDKWQKLTSKFNNISFDVTTNTGKTYTIRPLIATDAVHNDQHVAGTILFPHNIGMSCTHNPDNFFNVGKWTAQNVKKSGFNYAFAPTVAVSHNPQWGRFYETMGQEKEWIYKYGKAYVEGVQGKPEALTGILASVKHFIGDGATMFGADEGNAHVGNFKTFLEHNVEGYKGSIAAEVGSVMCSYSGINFLPVALSPLLNTVLRRKLSFDGFVISDYDDLFKIKDQQLPTSFQTFNEVNSSVCQMLNAGVDMQMMSSRGGYEVYAQAIKIGLKNNTITMDRLNDAVARIMAVKIALGVAKVKSNMREPVIEKFEPQISATSEYEDSLQAVHESLVLLKNANNVLPLQVSNLEYVVLVGEKTININNLAKNHLFLNYDNIGMQSGGWSIRWQGFEGNTQWEGASKVSSNASSILDALTNLKQKFELVRPNYTTFTEQTRVEIERTQFLNSLKTLRKKMTSKNTVILAVVGESPYAEFSGDVGVPYCKGALQSDGCLYGNSMNPYMPQKQRTSLDLEFDKFENQVIDHVREEDKNIPLVTVLLAGRPMFIDKILSESTAVLDAFLPGTSGGQGIVDGLFGAYKLRPNGSSDYRNTLSFDWPKTSAQIENFPYYSADGSIPSISDPLFKVGHGLSTSS